MVKFRDYLTSHGLFTTIRASRGEDIFAAWYNNDKVELQGRTPIRFSRSTDEGKTWNEPKIVADDTSGKILYCPPVFGISDDKLYMLINQMVSADHMHSLDLYIYNEESDLFECLWMNAVTWRIKDDEVRFFFNIINDF